MNPTNLLSEIEKATKAFRYLDNLIRSHNQEALRDIDLKDFDKLNHEYELYIYELSSRSPAQILRATCQKERNKRLREKSKSLSKSTIFTGEDVVNGGIAADSVVVIYKNRPVRHIGWVISDVDTLNENVQNIFKELVSKFLKDLLEKHPAASKATISTEYIDRINKQISKDHPVIAYLIEHNNDTYIRRHEALMSIVNWTSFRKYGFPTFVDFKSGTFIDAGFDTSALSQYGAECIPAVVMDDNNKLLSGPNIHRLSKVANIG